MRLRLPLSTLLAAILCTPLFADTSLKAQALVLKCLAAQDEAVDAFHSSSKCSDFMGSGNVRKKSQAAISACTAALGQISKEIPSASSNRRDHYYAAALVYWFRAISYANPSIARFQEAESDCTKNAQFAKASGDRELIKDAKSCMALVNRQIELYESCQ